MRLYVVQKVVDSRDLTYYNLDAMLWAQIELNTAIMCACMPALRPLISKIRPEWLSVNRSTPISQGDSDNSYINHAKAFLRLRATDSNTTEADRIDLVPWQTNGTHT